MKATQKDFLAVAPRAVRAAKVFFFCGPDEAGAAAAAQRIADLLEEPGERVELSGADLRKDPVLLADEARSTSLFAGARHIVARVSGDEGHDALANHVAAIDAGEGEPCPVLVVATSATDKARTAKLLEKRGDALVAMFWPPDLASVRDAVRTMGDELGLKKRDRRGRRRRLESRGNGLPVLLIGPASGAGEQTANEHEAAALADAGGVPGSLLVTFGAHGASWDGVEFAAHPVPAHRVRDTTGAGDAFCGALVAALAAGSDRTVAMEAALAAGAREFVRMVRRRAQVVGWAAILGPVLAVGLAGAALARLRPAGMATALFAAAAAHTLVAAIALFAGLGRPYDGPLKILLLNGFFIAAFGLSAWLFRRAARRG